MLPTFFEKFIKTTVPYEDDDDDLDERVEGYDEALAQFVTYLESNWIGTARPHAPRKKPRFAITTWTINESVLEGTEFSRNPARCARREEKRKAMKNLVLDYYTMNTGIFLDSAISFFNEF